MWTSNNVSLSLPLMIKRKLNIIASFTRATQDSKGRPMPQAIAHRGYKALYPENTMAAFEAAVEMGAHALETDLHLSKDGEIVLSHVRSHSRFV